MSVIYIGGVPGSGKTLFATYLAKKKFKKENNIFVRLFKKKRFLNIFSNYPILLDKNHYSFSISLNDFLNYNKHVPNCDIFFDEFQAYYDSLDFKHFPRTITKNFQFHRHFDINNIYVISQHPSRIVKQARILINEFYHITRFIRIPLINIGFLRYNIYYNFEDYGKSVKVDKSEVSYEFKKKFLIFRCRPVFKSYDTKYLKVLVKDKEYIQTKSFRSKTLPLEEITKNFNI